MSTAEFAYIGSLPDCGCTVAIVVDDPFYKASTAKDVADFIKLGYTVERVPLAEGIAKLHSCTHKVVPA